MTFSQRAIFLIIPVAGLLAFALINFNHNRIYYGSPQVKLPQGLYNIEGLRCLKAGKEFSFNQVFDDSEIKSHEGMKRLMMYDDLIARKILIDDQFFTPTFGSTNCKALYRMSIKENNFGRLFFSEVDHPKINPAGCTLTYTYRGKKYVDTNLIGDEDTELDLEMDRLVSHLIYKEGEIYLLYEERTQDLSDLGCAQKDQFVLLLSKSK